MGLGLGSDFGFGAVQGVRTRIRMDHDGQVWMPLPLFWFKVFIILDLGSDLVFWVKCKGPGIVPGLFLF